LYVWVVKSKNRNPGDQVFHVEINGLSVPSGIHVNVQLSTRNNHDRCGFSGMLISEISMKLKSYLIKAVNRNEVCPSKQAEHFSGVFGWSEY